MPLKPALPEAEVPLIVPVRPSKQASVPLSACSLRESPEIENADPAKQKTLKIATIRRLRADMELKSMLDGWKAAVIPEAERLTPDAANALLKIVEEPPPKDHPLLGLDSVIATPHLGAATGEAQVQVAVDIAHQVSEFLLEGTIRNAVNIPAVSPKELEVLGPHLNLGEKLGRLAAQLISEAPTEVTVGLGGEAANIKPEPLTAAASAASRPAPRSAC